MNLLWPESFWCAKAKSGRGNMIVVYFVGILLGLVFLVLLVSAILGVPFVPTHMAQAEFMFKAAGVGPGMKVVDLGSGEGRLLFLAARGGATAVGYELNPFLYWYTKLLIWKRGLGGRVEVKCESLYGANLREADVVMAFLFNKPMARLEHKLFSEMKSGSKVVSYTFQIPGRTPVVAEQGVYVYQV